MSYQILAGDWIERLRELPDESVNCCVTSPPYWGLRDYGVPGQLGLERTPEEYVAKMVEGFREVRRVLRSDGTLWMNLGDSYAGSWGNQGRKDERGTQRPINGPMIQNLEPYPDKQSNTGKIPNGSGLKPKDLCGIPWMVAFALRQPWTDWRIKSEAMRAWVAGIVDGEGCITILRTKSSHSDSLSFPPVVQVHMTDLEPLQRLVDVAGSSFGKPQMPPSHAAANQRESYQWKLVSESAAKVIAEIYPFLTCKRKQAIVAWNHQMFRAARGNQERKSGDIEKEQFCKELINKLNQRQPVDIPSWMKEPHVAQEPGWYLRQDCIWSKPNPMPESVTDRCTKAHEYLFLMTKSERYYCDMEAIKEESVTNDIRRPYGSEGAWALDGRPDEQKHGGEPRSFKGSQFNTGKTADHQLGRASDKPRKTKVPGGWDTGDGAHGTIHRTGRTEAEYVETDLGDKRNKRSVWTVSTSPFPEAHFATFPPKLVEPCILAGCPENGTVLDPFSGAGTSGLVATRLQRNYIGIELNPQYVAMAERRIEQDAPLFNGPQPIVDLLDRGDD